MRDVLCDSLYSSPQWALLINPFERCGDFLRVCEIRSQTSIFSLFLGKTKKNTFLKLLSASWMCVLLLLFLKEICSLDMPRLHSDLTCLLFCSSFCARSLDFS